MTDTYDPKNDTPEAEDVFNYYDEYPDEDPFIPANDTPLTPEEVYSLLREQLWDAAGDFLDVAEPSDVLEVIVDVLRVFREATAEDEPEYMYV